MLEGIKLERLSQALISLLQITNTDYALGGRESGEGEGVVMLGRGEVLGARKGNLHKSKMTT